jgi:hypothetical protein
MYRICGELSERRNVHSGRGVAEGALDTKNVFRLIGGNTRLYIVECSNKRTHDFARHAPDQPRDRINRPTIVHG